MENQIKSIAKSIQEMTNPQQVEETKFKVGDIVIAKKGPHKGDKHKVIYVSDDGKLNIQPLGRDVKYRQGAAGAMPNEVTLVKEDVQQVDEREIDSNAQGYPKVDQLISWMESNKLLPKNGREDYVDMNNGIVEVTVVYTELDKSDMKKLISHKAFISIQTEIVNYDAPALTFNFKYSAL